ncbi:MAG: hypothetical protein ACRCSF_11855 [Mycobacteriaceae bacterium]
MATHSTSEHSADQHSAGRQDTAAPQPSAPAPASSVDGVVVKAIGGFILGLVLMCVAFGFFGDVPRWADDHGVILVYLGVFLYFSVAGRIFWWGADIIVGKLINTAPPHQDSPPQQDSSSGSLQSGSLPVMSSPASPVVSAVGVVVAVIAIMVGISGVGGLGGVAVAGPAEECQAVRDRDHAVYLQVVAALPPGSPVPPEYVNPCVEAPAPTSTTTTAVPAAVPTGVNTGSGIHVGSNGATNMPSYSGTDIVPVPGVPGQPGPSQPGQPGPSQPGAGQSLSPGVTQVLVSETMSVPGSVGPVLSSSVVPSSGDAGLIRSVTPAPAVTGSTDNTNKGFPHDLMLVFITAAAGFLSARTKPGTRSRGVPRTSVGAQPSEGIPSSGVSMMVLHNDDAGSLYKDKPPANPVAPTTTQGPPVPAAPANPVTPTTTPAPAAPANPVVPITSTVPAVSPAPANPSGGSTPTTTPTPTTPANPSAGAGAGQQAPANSTPATQPKQPQVLVGIVDTAGQQEGKPWVQDLGNGQTATHTIVEGTGGQTVDTQVTNADGSRGPTIRETVNDLGGVDVWSDNPDGSADYGQLNPSGVNTAHYQGSPASGAGPVVTSQGTAGNLQGSVTASNPDGTTSTNTFNTRTNGSVDTTITNPDGSIVMLNSSSDGRGGASTTVLGELDSRGNGWVMLPNGQRGDVFTDGNGHPVVVSSDPTTGNRTYQFTSEGMTQINTYNAAGEYVGHTERRPDGTVVQWSDEAAGERWVTVRPDGTALIQFRGNNGNSFTAEYHRDGSGQVNYASGAVDVFNARGEVVEHRNPPDNRSSSDRFAAGIVNFAAGVGSAAVDAADGLGTLAGVNVWDGTEMLNEQRSVWGGVLQLDEAALATMLLGSDIANSGYIPGLDEGEASALLDSVWRETFALDGFENNDTAFASGRVTFNLISALVGTRGTTSAARAVSHIDAPVAAVTVEASAISKLPEVAKLPESVSKLPDIAKTPEVVKLPDIVKLPETVAITERPTVIDAVTPVLDRAGMTVQDLQVSVSTPIDELSSVSAAVVNEARHVVPEPGPNEIMQRVIPDGPQLQSILADEFLNQKFPANNVSGFSAVASDISHITTVERLFEALRLDYTGSPFAAALDSVYALRFSLREGVPGVPDAPLSELVPGAPAPGSPDVSSWPFTGSGWTSSSQELVPEYVIPEGGRMNPGAELVQIFADGTEQIIRILEEIAVNDFHWVEVQP